MDFTHLQSLLQTLQTKPQKIRTLVDYILMNTSSNQNQIALALQKAFNTYNLQKQMAIFFTISEILLITSKKRDVAYFKAFGAKIKMFLDKLANQIQDLRYMKDICRTIDKWQQQQLFVTNFIQKLKHVIKQFYNKIRQQQNEQNYIFGGYKKYKKTFLMELNDIRNYSLCNEMYSNYCQYIELEQKLTNLNVQFSKIDFDKQFSLSTTSNQEKQKRPVDEINKRRSQELLKIYKQTRQKLQNLLIKIQKSFIKLRQWTLKQYDIVKNQYQQSGANEEQHF